MNDFEQELARQPLRRLPPEWRNELLAAAREVEPAAPPAPWWHGLLGWQPAALAAGWTIAAAFYFATPAQPHPSPGGISPTAWQARAEAVRFLMAEQFPPVPQSLPRPPRPPAVKPQSSFTPALRTRLG